MKITTAVELDLNLLDGLDGVDVREHPAYVSPALRDSLAALNSGTISEEQFVALDSKDMYAENGFTFDTLSHPVLYSVVSERHGKDGSYSSLHQGLSPVGDVPGVYKVMSVTSHDGPGADIDYHSDADITYMAVDGKSVAKALHVFSWNVSDREVDDLMDMAHSFVARDNHNVLVPQMVGDEKIYRNEMDDVTPDMNFVPGEKSLPYLRNASIIHSSFDESFGFMARDMVHEFSEGKTLQQFFEDAVVSIRNHTSGDFQQYELSVLNDLSNGVMKYEKGMDERFDFIEAYDAKQAAKDVAKEDMPVELDMSEVGKKRSGDKSKDKGR